MFFNDYLLSYIGASVDALLSNNVEHYVLTPQITRQWDDSWDIIVNKNLLDRQLNDNLTADVFDLGLTSFGDVGLRPIENFKAAGGWCTVISNDLLELTGIPESFGHYGLEDTFVMACAMMLIQRGENIGQFVMENLIVGENHKNRPNETIKQYLSLKDRKEEFKKIAHSNWETEINKFYNK